MPPLLRSLPISAPSPPTRLLPPADSQAWAAYQVFLRAPQHLAKFFRTTLLSEVPSRSSVLALWLTCLFNQSHLLPQSAHNSKRPPLRLRCLLRSPSVLRRKKNYEGSSLKATVSGGDEGHSV